ncbi:MAG: rhomboid family intramembrane serine protease [Sedimentisphaerales bacterium]|nr:rhomboid family intramembrane serine protease [Sedimentisphaerales bacterium]
MKCPVCSNNLRVICRGSTAVNTCVNCGGIWFDRDELLPFVKDLSDKHPFSPEEPTFFRPRDVNDLSRLDEERRICPRCQCTMKKVDYCADSNIFIDRCPNCRGVWTDYGEARRIARYLKSNPAAVTFAEDVVSKDRKLTAWEDITDTCRVLRTKGYHFMYLPTIVLPLSDETPVERPPIVTLSLIGVCVFVFLAQVLFTSSSQFIFHTFGLVPTHFWGIGLVTSLFLHSDILHLLGNMYFLWIFGDNVESRFTLPGYLGFYFACGLAAVGLHAVFNIGSTIPTIGASGAISGIMGAYLVFYPSAVIKTFFLYRIIRVPAVLYLISWFVLQLAYAFAFGMDKPNFTGVAWFAHVGGFTFGAVFAYIKKRMSNPEIRKVGY